MERATGNGGGRGGGGVHVSLVKGKGSVREGEFCGVMLESQ